MQLPGSLRRTTLGDVLGALFRERATGWLELTEQQGVGAERVHRIGLEHGLIASVYTPAGGSRLGDVLKSQNLVDSRGLELALSRCRDQAASRRLGDALVEARLLDRATVERAIRGQNRSRLEALFALRDARIAFRVARRRETSTWPLLPGDFLHGRPRLRDRGTASRSASGATRASARQRALGLLGLDDGAGPAQVQRAFRRLAVRFHPDRFPGASQEERAVLMRRFAELSAAYHALSA